MMATRAGSKLLNRPPMFVRNPFRIMDPSAISLACFSESWGKLRIDFTMIQIADKGRAHNHDVRLPRNRNIETNDPKVLMESTYVIQVGERFPKGHRETLLLFVLKKARTVESSVMHLTTMNPTKQSKRRRDLRVIGGPVRKIGHNETRSTQRGVPGDQLLRIR